MVAGEECLVIKEEECEQEETLLMGMPWFWKEQSNSTISLTLTFRFDFKVSA